MFRIILTHGQISTRLYFDNSPRKLFDISDRKLLLPASSLESFQKLFKIFSMKQPLEGENPGHNFYSLTKFKLHDTIQPKDISIKIEKRTNNPGDNEESTYISATTDEQLPILRMLGLAPSEPSSQYVQIPSPVATAPIPAVDPHKSQTENPLSNSAPPLLTSRNEPNWFISGFSRFKNRTWDRLPTWGKLVIGSILVLGTLVGLGAITFGTAGLIAPAFAASLVVGLHLAGAGVSIPLAAFIGALVGGSVAAVLFGVIPATAAISSKVAESSSAPLIAETHSTSWSGCFSGFVATLTCDKFGNDETQYQKLVGDEQQSTCCTGGTKKAAHANAADDSCFKKHLPESCGGTPKVHKLHRE